MIGDATHVCARCGQRKPRTTEHFRFTTTGRVSGYCRPCHSDWGRAYWAAASDYQRARHRASARASQRRRRGITPDRYRVEDAR